MIEKKDPRYNLEKNRATIFGIGLLVAGSFTLAAFTYTSPLEVEEAKIASGQSDVMYSVYQEDAPKPELKTEEVFEEKVELSEPTTEVLSEISEKSKEKKNTATAVSSEVTSGQHDFKKGMENLVFERRKVEAEIVPYPDLEPQYKGGTKEMVRFIQKTQMYPDDAVQAGDQGTAYVKFVIEKDGSISNISVEGKVAPSLKKEAKRIVRNFPNWTPGEVAGKRVRSSVHLPITFVLE